jgi:hypothetical protein
MIAERPSLHVLPVGAGRIAQQARRKDIANCYTAVIGYSRLVSAMLKRA